MEGLILKVLGTLFLFILGTSSAYSMCGGDTARAFENSLSRALNPKINARSFTTAADGSEELLEVVIEPNGIAKLSRDGVSFSPGPNDTLRYWVTDSKGVRLERYITGEAKGQKAVTSFFSKASKGDVSASEAKNLGNKFKAMSAADQANLVGGIENKLRKGAEITEAEFLIAVKGQTGWRTLDGLLSSHLPNLQAAYRSGDVTTAFKKVLDSWGTKTSDVTKGRLTRIGSLLKEQFANKPKVIDAPPARITDATSKSTDLAVIPGKEVATTTGREVATTGNQVAVRGPLVGEIVEAGTEVGPLQTRLGIEVDPIEGVFTRVDDVVKIEQPQKLIEAAPSDASIPRIGNTGGGPGLPPGKQLELELPPTPNKDIKGPKPASGNPPEQLEMDLAGGKGTSNPQLELELTGGKAVDPPKGPKPDGSDANNGRRLADKNPDPNQLELPLDGNPRQLELDLKGGRTAKELEEMATKQKRFFTRLKESRFTKAATLALISGSHLAKCFLEPECTLEKVIATIKREPTLEEIKNNYSFEVKAEDQENGDILCTYKISKKLGDDAKPEEISNQAELDKVFSAQHLTVKWIRSESLKSGNITYDCSEEKNNNKACTIESDLAKSKVQVGYTAKLFLGDKEAGSDSNCKNKAEEKKPVIADDPKDDGKKDEGKGDGEGNGNGDPSWYGSDKKEEDRTPAAIDPDPWNILGGNTGKKFPLTPPQPLIPPRNPQMYVTPGYY